MEQFNFPHSFRDLSGNIQSDVSLILSLVGVFHKLLPLDVVWVAIVICGISILLGAVRGLVFDHDIKADVLLAMVLAASVATGEVALIMQIGSLLENCTSGKAKKGIEKLIRLTPQTAHVIRDGMEIELPAEQVRVHDVVRVLAGETIPVDGTILTGETTIDPCGHRACGVLPAHVYPCDTDRGFNWFLTGIGNAAKYGIIVRSGDALERISRIQRVAFDKTGTLTCGRLEVAALLLGVKDDTAG